MTVKEKTIEIVAAELKVSYAQAEESRSLSADLGCDDFDLMTIVVETEDRFGIRVTDKEMDGIQSTMDLVRLTQAKVNALGA